MKLTHLVIGLLAACSSLYGYSAPIEHSIPEAPPKRIGNRYASVPKIHLGRLNPKDYLQLGHSPELRQNAQLDELVEKLSKDPMSLARYVYNEIELIDAYHPIDQETGEVYLGSSGINRSALGVYLEKQGSPEEQCALLLYLLRKAGVPAAYAQASAGELKVSKDDLGNMLGIPLAQVTDIPDEVGVDYPWVIAHVEGKWVHLFPWMQGNRITDGHDLRTLLPEDFQDAQKWLEGYMKSDPKVVDLAHSDQVSDLWPKFVQNALKSSNADLSMSDLGVHVKTQKRNYSSWQGMPTPAVDTDKVRILESFKESKEHFNTLAFEISGPKTSGKIQTGPLYICDLHNKRINGYFDDLETFKFSVGIPGFKTRILSIDPKKEDKLVVKDTRTIFKPSSYKNTCILNLSNVGIDIGHSELGNKIINEKHVLIGDAFAYCFQLGRVTEEMIAVHKAELKQSHEDGNNTEELSGILNLLGMLYWKSCTDFNYDAGKSLGVKKQHEFGAGYAFMSALRIKGALPKDMSVTFTNLGLDITQNYFHESLTGSQLKENPQALIKDFHIISSAHRAAAEHGTIEKLWKDRKALSALKLLNLSNHNASEQDTPYIKLTKQNYLAEGEKTYSDASGNQLKLREHAPRQWEAIKKMLSEDPTGHAVAYITAGPAVLNSEFWVGSVVMDDTGVFESYIGDLLHGTTQEGRLPDIVLDKSIGKLGKAYSSLSMSFEVRSFKLDELTTLYYARGEIKTENKALLWESVRIYTKAIQNIYSERYGFGPTAGGLRDSLGQARNHDINISLQGNRKNAELGHEKNMHLLMKIKRQLKNYIGDLQREIDRIYNRNNVSHSSKMNAIHKLHNKQNEVKEEIRKMGDAEFKLTMANSDRRINDVNEDTLNRQFKFSWDSDRKYNNWIANIKKDEFNKKLNELDAQIAASEASISNAQKSAKDLEKAIQLSKATLLSLNSEKLGDKYQVKLEEAQTSLQSVLNAQSEPNTKLDTAIALKNSKQSEVNRLVNQLNANERGVWASRKKLAQDEYNRQVAQSKRIADGRIKNIKNRYPIGKPGYMTDAEWTNAQAKIAQDLERVRRENMLQLDRDKRSAKSGLNMAEHFINNEREKQRRSITNKKQELKVATDAVKKLNDELVAKNQEHLATINSASKSLKDIQADYLYNSFIQAQQKYDNTRNTLGAVQLANISDELNYIEKIPEAYGLKTSSKEAFIASLDKGALKPGIGSKICSVFAKIGDPVDVATGAFIVDETDLVVHESFDTVIARNYSSHNTLDGDFGYGWKSSIVPYLVLSQDGQVIKAAEEDGTVLTYRKTGANTWTINAQDNPGLTSRSHLGPRVENLLNNYIHFDGSSKYTLNKASGTQKVFEVKAFPIGKIDRKRPYLTASVDPEGNRTTYSFGNSPEADDYGKLNKIILPNKSEVHINYDAYGHITEITTNDGRIALYHYDPYGNLVWTQDLEGYVTEYKYDNKVFKEDGQEIQYSTHLLVDVIKPEGRGLRNVYDKERRVVEQLATVGKDTELHKNAEFIYADNGDFTARTVKDSKGNSTEYHLYRGLIYKIIDPLDHQILQDWNIDRGVVLDAQSGTLQNSSQTGTFPMSLNRQIDKRGLIKEYAYNSEGLLTQLTLKGDLTGDGKLNEQVVHYKYNNAGHMIEKRVGKRTQTIEYDAVFKQLPSKITYENTVQEITYKKPSKQDPSRGLIEKILTKDLTGKTLYTKTFAYDKHPRPETITEQWGPDQAITTNLHYNSQGLLAFQQTQDGVSTHTEYNLKGQKIAEILKNVQGELLGKSEYYYNGNGEVAWVDGPKNGLEDFKHVLFDRGGRAKGFIQWDTARDFRTPDAYKTVSSVYSFDHDIDGNLVKSTDPDGIVTRFTFDSLQRVASKEVAGYKEDYTYEPGGQLATASTSTGDTKITYTTNGLPCSWSLSDGNTIKVEYDLQGRVIYTSSNGKEVETIYNDEQNTIAKHYKDTDKTETDYLDNLGRTVKHIDVHGIETTYQYDGLSRVTKMSDSKGQSVDITYNDTKKEVSITNTKGESKYIKRDDLERVIEERYLDAEGKLVHIERNEYAQDGHSFTKIYGQGPNEVRDTIRLNAQRKPLYLESSSGYYQFDYSPSGMLTRMLNAQGHATTFQYNDLGQLESKTLPGKVTVGYQYNASGQLKKLIEPNDRVWSYHYNDAGQLTNNRTPGGTVFNYTFDAEDRLESVQSGDEVVQYVHGDNKVDIIRLRAGKEVSKVSRTFDLQGQVKSETITLDGKEVSSVTRDEGSLVAKLGSQEKRFDRKHNVFGALVKNGTIDLNYDTSGLIAGLDIDHVSRNYHYKKGLPETISTQSQGKNVLAETLTWNSGLISSVKSDTKTTQYQYDSLGHLRKAGTYEYTHCKGPDSAQYLCQGEDWFREGPGKTLFTSVEVPKIISGEAENAKTLQVSVNGQLKHHFPVKGQKRWSAEVDLPAGQTNTICARAYDFEGLFEEDTCTVNVPTLESTSKYDSEGHLIKRTYTSGKTQTFEWNPWGQLEKMIQKDPGGNNYTFTAQYDPLGRRIQTTFKDQTTTYVYNPEVEFETLGHQDNTGTYWHHQSPQGLEAIEDSQGTITTLINNAQHHGVGHIEGQKVVHYGNPTPYGKIQGKKGPYQTYRGKPYDPTGLIYMGARYYDPNEAEFLSPDPYGYTGSTNLYAYANGDPINYYDPDGRLSQAALKATGATIADVWTDPRFQGGLTAFGGLGEVAGGVALATVGSPSVGLSVAGGLLATHGADTFQTGLRQIWQNQHTGTYAEDLMQSAGMSPGTAMLADTAIGMVSIGGLMKSGAFLPRVALATESYEATIVAKPQPRMFTPPYLVDDGFQGIRDASEYLIKEGASREQRLRILNSFEKGTVRTKVADSNTFGLRFHDNGKKAQALGQYLFPTFTNSINRMNLGLPFKWNEMSALKQWKVRNGLVYIEGKAAPIVLDGIYYPGGVNQMFVFKPRISNKLL